VRFITTYSQFELAMSDSSGVVVVLYTAPGCPLYPFFLLFFFFFFLFPSFLPPGSIRTAYELGVFEGVGVCRMVLLGE